MSIIQWNIQSIRTNFNELKFLLTNLNPSCVCLQETMLGSHQMNSPTGYTIVQSPRKRDDGHERSVAILIKNTINFSIIPLDTELQAVAVRIWLGKWYNICSLYLPHIPIQQNSLENLISQLPCPFLLLGDMNAKHPLWNENPNDKGELFFNLIQSNNISLLNSQSPTHFHIQTGTYSTIDLSICSSDCILDFSHKVMENLHGSDHYPILIEHSSNQEPIQFSERFKMEKADWAKFETITKSFKPPENLTNIDNIIQNLESSMISAAEASIPRSEGRRGKTPLPWWNANCQRVADDRKRAERALRRRCDTANKIAFKRTKAICRKTFIKARKESWIKYVSSININTSSKQVWERVKKISGKFKNQPLPLLRDANGDNTEDPAVTSNIFARAFASVSEIGNYTPTFQNVKTKTEKKSINFSTNENLAYNDSFSVEEFNYALSNTSETSPGYDKITYSMIKRCHYVMKSYILEIFNKIYSEQCFPQNWKLSVILPLPKVGKDRSQPLNYRPISLTSCLCKLLEKMVNKRLMWYLEQGDYISKTQSGFRQNRSTTDSIVKFETDIRQAITRKEHSVAVFFDLTKAYDMAWRHGIIQKLYSFNLRGNLPIFIRNFMSGRKIQVRVGNTLSDEVSITEGTPQGSVLSCTLFMVAIDDVIAALPSGVHSTLYVDDLCIYASGNSLNMIERKLQIAINHLEKWCDKTGFVFSPSKSVAMHICRKRLCPRMAHQLTLNQTPIPQKDSHTFLGMKIDNKLNWDSHIKDIKIQCSKKLDLLKHLSHTTWGADLKTLTRLYLMLIKPKIDYGLEAYSSANEKTLAKLEPIQNNALRIATGAFRSSPIASLQTISGIKPLVYFRNNKILNYFLRIISNDNNPMNSIIQNSEVFEEDFDEESPDLPTMPSFLERCKMLLNKYRVEFHSMYIENMSVRPPWLMGDIRICPEMSLHNKNDKSPEFFKNKFLQHLEEHEDSYKIYTDGSKTSNGVACAFANDELEVAHKLGTDSSIFAAELTAIMMAIEKYLTINQSFQKISIFSDSKSSIQAISKPFPKNPIISRIHEMIQTNHIRLSLCWVPSHVGIAGNEKADKLALAATNNVMVQSSMLLQSDIKNKIKYDSHRMWKENWRCTDPSQNKLREISDTPNLSNISCPNRQWERALVRLRIGHSHLTHGHLMSRSSSPTCEDCGEEYPLTIKHILIECPFLETSRRQHLLPNQTTMRSLLAEGDTSHGGRLYRFIRSINLITKL